MKKSKAETAETRKRIVDVASQEFRRKGIHASNLAEIMSEAGLTHGAFYRHFESKDQLVAEAFAKSMETLIGASVSAADQGGDAPSKYVRAFLSREYHEDFQRACPFVTMGSELAHADLGTREVASSTFRDLITVLTQQNPNADRAVAKGDAMFFVSAMVGAVTLARLVSDQQLSDEILGSARDRLAPEQAPQQMVEAVPTVKKRAAAKKAPV